VIIFSKQKGFTVIELIVVIAIIGILASIVIVNVNSIREKSYVSAAGSTQREMTEAVQLYYLDMGFYPPDVNRGWDPGLVKSQPWSPDAPSEGGFSTSGANCAHCPSDWQQIILSNWHGPYLSSWPQHTPWRGKYDYNYWSVETLRAESCPSRAGVYMGVEKDYDDSSGAIPPSAEVEMARYGFDTNCPNGEAQMMLIAL